DGEGRTPLCLATDPAIRHIVSVAEEQQASGVVVGGFDLHRAVENNDIKGVARFLSEWLQNGSEECSIPNSDDPSLASAAPGAAADVRALVNRPGRGGMTAVHLAAFHGYKELLQITLQVGGDPNAYDGDGETPLHVACTGGSVEVVTMLLDHGANPLATDGNGLVPCEKHHAAGRQDIKRLLENRSYRATPANLRSMKEVLMDVEEQLDAEENLFVRKGVAIKHLRNALDKQSRDTQTLRTVVDARDREIRSL
ncbi:unnamed protein product, partial [Discosporangium mesarthrocarpum]